MANKTNPADIIDGVQRSMASRDSNKKGSVNSREGHSCGDGYTCSPACGFEGYCDFEATRYYRTDKGKTELKNNKEKGHTYYRREMRL